MAGTSGAAGPAAGRARRRRYLDGRADAVGRDRALGERRARADGELVEPDGLVGLLEAVDERPALDRRAAPYRVHPPVGGRPARRHVKAEPDLVPGLPHAAHEQVAAGRSHRPFWRIVDGEDGGGGRPGRDADCQAPRFLRRAEHADRDKARPRVAGVDLDVEARARQARARVLLHGQRVAGRRGQVVLDGGEQAHDVRRAAGAAEPDAPAARVVLLEVILTALQRVHVEEPVAGGGDRGGEAVVEHALHVVGVLRVAGGEQQPPAPVEAGDRRAGLVVRAVGRQLEPVAEPLVLVPRAVPAGQVRLGGDHVGPAADRGGEQFASPVSTATSVTPASR